MARRPLLTLFTATALALVAGCTDEGGDRPVGTGGGDPAAPIPLTSPAPGEVSTIGTRMVIEWEVPSDLEQVDIVLTHPDLGDQLLAAGEQNDGRYEWSVPLIHAERSRDYRIRVVESGTSPEIDPSPDVTVAVGSLAGFRWNGTEEEYYWIDLVTGDTTVLGTVGDMKWWQYKGSAAFDATQGVAWVLASPDDANTIWKLYALEASTGALVSDVELQGEKPSGINVNSQGDVIGFRWNAATNQEEVVAVDTTTGAVTVLDTVGDLEGWTVEAVHDPANDRIYLIGDSATNVRSLYVVDALTGALLDQQPLGGPNGDTSVIGLALNRAGKLVGFRWNEVAQEEEVVELDPTTGTLTPIGIVGDLQAWVGYSSINITTNEIYVFGENAAQEKKLYTVDATTGALLYDLPVAEYPTTTLLVF